MNFITKNSVNQRKSVSKNLCVQLQLILQNKANFRRFLPKNRDQEEKQTQFEPKTNPIWNYLKSEY